MIKKPLSQMLINRRQATKLMGAAGLFPLLPSTTWADKAQEIESVATKGKTFGHSLIGSPKYNKTTKVFDYLNPDAPKGGTIRLAALGTFDSFNQYIAKGNPFSHQAYTQSTLMEASYDEFNQHVVECNIDFKERIIRQVQTMKLRDTNELNQAVSIFV